MSELYGHLSRVFLEVTPLYPQARKPRGKKKTAEPGLFAEAAELVLIQQVPGVFVERPHAQVQDRPCFVVLDTPQPVLLPGTTADFMDADFLFPAYQVPFHTGRAGGINLDPRVPERMAQAKCMGLAQVLDSAIQRLLQQTAASGLSPAFAHHVVDKLRVWALEDYVKPSYLKTVLAVMTEITDALYDSPLPDASAKTLRDLVAEVRKATRALSASGTAKTDLTEVFYQTWLQLIPHLKDNAKAAALLRAFMNDPQELRAHVSSHNNPDLPWLPRICAKQLAKGAIIVNEGISTFVELQLQ